MKDAADFDRDSPFVSEKEPPKRSARIPTDKPIDAAMTKPELRKNIYFVFNGIARAFHLPNVEDFPDRDLLRFEEDEFDDSAEAFMIIANQHSQARVLFRIISPLAGLGALVNAFARLVASFEQKRQMDAAKRAAKQQQGQPLPNSTATEGDESVTNDANGASKRGSFFPRIGGR